MTKEQEYFTVIKLDIDNLSVGNMPTSFIENSNARNSWAVANTSFIPTITTYNSRNYILFDAANEYLTLSNSIRSAKGNSLYLNAECVFTNFYPNQAYGNTIFSRHLSTATTYWNIGINDTLSTFAVYNTSAVEVTYFSFKKFLPYQKYITNMTVYNDNIRLYADGICYGLFKNANAIFNTNMTDDKSGTFILGTRTSYIPSTYRMQGYIRDINLSLGENIPIGKKSFTKYGEYLNNYVSADFYLPTLSQYTNISEKDTGNNSLTWSYPSVSPHLIYFDNKDNYTSWLKFKYTNNYVRLNSNLTSASNFVLEFKIYPFENKFSNLYDSRNNTTNKNGLVLNCNSEYNYHIEDTLVVEPETVSMLKFNTGTTPTYYDEKGNTWSVSAGTPSISTLKSRKSGSSVRLNNASIRNVDSSNNADYQLKNKSWTINLSVLIESFNATNLLLGRFTATTGSIEWYITIDASGVYFITYSNGSSTFKTYSFYNKILTNKWYDLELSSNGTVVSLFINKLKIASYTIDYTFWNTQASSYIQMGSTNFSGSEYYLNGYIDEFSIMTNKQRNIKSYTKNGDFLETCLLFEGINNSTTFIDSGNTIKTWTPNGNAKLSTTQPDTGLTSFYALNVGTTPFYITHASNPNSSYHYMHLDDFTIKTRIYINSFNTLNYIMSKDSGTNNARLHFYITATSIVFQFQSPNPSISATGLNLVTGKWYDITVTRENGVAKLYLDDVLISRTATGWGSYIVDLSDNQLAIGLALWDTAGNAGFNGYIKNFYIYKGRAVSPVKKVVPDYYLDFENIAYNDIANDSYWNLNGTPTTSNIQKYRGANSGAFNGSTNFITKNINFYNNDFIVNFYLYFNTLPDAGYHHGILDFGNSTYGASGFSVTVYNNSGTAEVWLRQASTGEQVLSGVITNTWYKVAIKCVNKVLTLHINDIYITSNSTQNTNIGTEKLFQIGYADSNNKQTGDYYIDEFKIYKRIKDNSSEIPKSIYLEFDGNLTDTTGNSTWSNPDGTGVIYDNYVINDIAYQGSYYDGTKKISSTNATNLNFSTNDFTVAFKCAKNGSGNNYGKLLSSGQTSFVDGSRFISYNENGSTGLYWQESSTTNSFVTDMVLMNNCPYEIKYVRIGTKLKVYINKVLINTVTISSGLTFNFAGSSNSIIADALWDSGDSGKFKGGIYQFYAINGVAEEEYEPASINTKIVDMDFNISNEFFRFDDKARKVVWSSNTITATNFYNSVIKFDGSTTFLQSSKNTNLNFGTGNFTIDFSINPQSMINKYQAILYNGNTSWSAGSVEVLFFGDLTGTGHSLEGIADGKISISAYNVADYITNSLIPLNEFTKVTIIRTNSTTIEMYVNDVLDATHTIDASLQFNFNNNNNTIIGKSTSATETFLNAELDYIKIYSDGNYKYNNNNGVILQAASANGNYDLILKSDKIDANKECTIKAIKKDDYMYLMVDDVIHDQALFDNPIYFNNSTITFGNNQDLAGSYDGLIRDIKYYTTGFLDVDTFTYQGMYDVSIPDYHETDDYKNLNSQPMQGYIIEDQIEYIESPEHDKDMLLPELGSVTIVGFVEGHTDHSYYIYNKFRNTVLIYGDLDETTGDGVDYAYSYLNSTSIKNLYLYDNNLKIEYPVPQYIMEKGYISIDVSSIGCSTSGYYIRLLRHDTGRWIGDYGLEDNQCTIYNLDVSQAYDVLLMDSANTIETQVSSNRYPEPI